MRLSSQGFTLVETMFGVLLAGITLLVTFSLAHQFYRGYIEIQNKLEAEKAVTMAMSHLQRQLSLGINLERSATSLNGVNISATTAGKILEYDGSSMGPTPGQVDTVAIFIRENGGFQAPPQSQYLPIGIFYARPTPTTSGVIFVDTSTAPTKTPSYSNLFFSNVVSFTTSNFIFSPAGVLTSMDFSLTVRSFLNADTREWNFCPPLDITNGAVGCTGVTTTFKDVERTMQVTFSNQIIQPASQRNMNLDAPFERVFGNIYLFPHR